MLKLHFGRFWPPTWAQHGTINRSKNNQNPPEWPPGADLAAKRPPDPSRRPSWPLRGSILAPPGTFFLSFRCFWASLPGSKRKRKRKAQDATRKRKRSSKPEIWELRNPRSLKPWVAAGGREAIRITKNPQDRTIFSNNYNNYQQLQKFKNLELFLLWPKTRPQGFFPINRCV